ncbi:MAG: signal peptidase I [Candidatus Aminicenantes bacterium]|nr:signal peptidase I [Candidatus Aminicenantes bacterium]
MTGKNGNNPQSEDYGFSGVVWEIVKMVFWVVVIIVPIRVFLIQPFFVQGASMEPNFEDREYLIVNELGYKTTNVGLGSKENTLFTVKPFKELRRGDVVVFRYPKSPKVFYIKRIIALPGEKIQISNGQVKISNAENPNGFVLDEGEYLSVSEETAGEINLVLGDEYFVMGDNRKYSSDSRSWGPVPAEDVMGKVILRAWPIGKATLF